jgi:hypothetical protein
MIDLVNEHLIQPKKHIEKLRERCLPFQQDAPLEVAA